MPEPKILPGEPEEVISSYVPHVARGAIINFSGILIRLVLVYGYTFILARLMSVGELGEYFLMLAIVNLLGLASMVGLDLGVVRYVALYAGEGKLGLARKALRAGLMFGLPVSLVFMAGLFFAAPFVSAHFFESNAEAVTGLRIFSVAIPFLVTARLFNATTQGMHQMKYQVLSRDFGEQVAKIGFSALLLCLGGGLVGVVWANLASLATAVTLALVFAMVVLAGPKGSSDTRIKPTLAVFKYSFPLAFANIVVALTLWVDTLMLGYLGTTEDVGFYGVALKISIIGAKIITAFVIVFTPVIADLWNRGRLEELKKLYVTVSRWIFMLSIPIFLVLILFPDSLMRIFGSTFIAGSAALVFLAIGQMMNAATGAAGIMVLMSGHSKLELLNVTTTLAMNAAICFLLIPRYGVVGAAIANMAALGLVNLMRIIEIWIFMRIFGYDRSYLKPALSGLAVALVVGLIGRFVIVDAGIIQLLALASLLLLLYVLALAGLGLEEQDKNMLKKIKASLLRIKIS
ncbi:MAG: flippase [Thermoleophilia bacterium]